jgi:flagellar assembly protein FliH
MSAVLAAGAMPIRRWELPSFGACQGPATAGNAPTVRELAELQAQAHAEGYAAGHAEGLAAGEQAARDRLAHLDALLASAARPLMDMDAHTEQELASLAMIIARRVIAAELRLAPGLIVRAVQQAAAVLPSATQELRVQVHPDDLPLLQGAAGVDSHWQCSADATLARGGCRLTSMHSHLDAGLETRLAAVIDAVIGDDVPRAEDEA